MKKHCITKVKPLPVDALTDPSEVHEKQAVLQDWRYADEYLELEEGLRRPVQA